MMHGQKNIKIMEWLLHRRETSGKIVAMTH